MTTVVSFAAAANAPGDPQHGSPLPLRLSQIIPDPDQPRKTFITKETEELAASIEAESQQTPVHVFRHPDPAQKGIFMLSAGERRWRAFSLIAARTKTDPIVYAYVIIVTDKKLRFRKAFLENLHRKDLPALDEAASYARLRLDGETLEGIAKLCDRSLTHIQNYLKLNELSPAVKAWMDPNLPKEELLSVSAAIEIAKSIAVPDKQLEIAREIIDRQLTINDTRLLLGVRAQDSTYTSGKKFRNPSDDYKVFKAFLGRTRKAANTFALQTLGRLYTYRDNDEADRNNDIREIEYIRSQLDRILQQLQKKE